MFNKSLNCTHHIHTHDIGFFPNNPIKPIDRQKHTHKLINHQVSPSSVVSNRLQSSLQASPFYMISVFIRISRWILMNCLLRMLWCDHQSFLGIQCIARTWMMDISQSKARVQIHRDSSSRTCGISKSFLMRRLEGFKGGRVNRWAAGWLDGCLLFYHCSQEDSLRIDWSYTRNGINPLIWVETFRWPLTP